MGNTRRFRAGRQGRVETLKERNRRLTQEAGYYRGLALASAAELEAMKMERPVDLEDWIDSILPEMSDEERAQFEGLTEAEREDFLDGLGQKINVSQALLDH